MNSQIISYFCQCFPLSRFFEKSLSSSVTLTDKHPSPGHHQREKYEVFISFRGSDVRHTFLSHLFAALGRKQIHTFIDDDLHRGEDIRGSLFQIIEESSVSIVILSTNYPKSRWCLAELDKVHESMKLRKCIVVPIFYEVDPSDVRNFRGNYAVDLRKCKHALVEISNLSGFVSKQFSNDANLIDAIVNDVSMKLSDMCPSNMHNIGLFGIDSLIKDVESLLSLESLNDVRLIGIWGMGGIGKTTIVAKVFDRIRKNFDGYCFVSNVGETLSLNCDLKELRGKIVCELLGDKDMKMHSAHSIDDSIRRRLKRIRALIVLDDVHTCMQLKSLLEYGGLCPDTFCPGSRIIVTSRDWQVLDNVSIKSDIYQAKQLEDDEALQLFSWHAFGQNKPQEEYEKISKEVVKYSHGVPLALVVLGSELKRKPSTDWEDALAKFNDTSPSEIQKILRISFHGLDWNEKNIFLDIACFLKGSSRTYVENVLNAFGSHATIGISRLIDKSLIIEEGENITMHDLLQQMGQEIVIEEKQRQLHQSRLWCSDDVREALTNNRGTENVEVILPRQSYTKRQTRNRIDISPKAFIPMCKLRFLRIHYKVQFPMGLEFLPDTVRYLYWDSYPLNYLPSSYNPEKLVGCHLSGSQLKQLIWNEPLKNLKHVNLSCSNDLIKISDLAMAPNLEVLDLRFCKSLVEIGSSIENLNKLTRLDLTWCKNLSLLGQIPFSIKELHLKHCGIRQLPSRIGHLTHLTEISLESCTNLQSLPNSICNLTSLKLLDVSNCRVLNELPENFGNLESLEKLDASYSGLMELPLSIKNLKRLTRLDVRGCTSLYHLSEIPCSIVELELRWSGLRKLPSSIGLFTHFKELLFDSCESLESLPSSLCNQISLKRLVLSKCRNLNKLPENFGDLESLEELDASYSGLRELPLSINNLKKLVLLSLIGCEYLESLPDLPLNLKVLDARNCKSLESVPIFEFSISVDLSSCPKLEASAIMEKYLQEAHCRSTKMPDLCISGSEMPEWMMYCNDSGSFVLDLDSTGQSISLIFCVVIASNATHNHNRYSPVAILATEVGEMYCGFGEICCGFGETYFPFSSYERVDETRKDTLNVFLWSFFHIPCNYVKGVLFGRRLHSAYGNMMFGVHPIFKNESHRQVQIYESSPKV